MLQAKFTGVLMQVNLALRCLVLGLSIVDCFFALLMHLKKKSEREERRMTDSNVLPAARSKGRSMALLQIQKESGVARHAKIGETTATTVRNERQTLRENHGAVGGAVRENNNNNKKNGTRTLPLFAWRVIERTGILCAVF